MHWFASFGICKPSLGITKAAWNGQDGHLTICELGSLLLKFRVVYVASDMEDGYLPQIIGQHGVRLISVAILLTGLGE
jgi:hypothetical protein